MSEIDALMKAFGDAGGDRAILANNEIAHPGAGAKLILKFSSIVTCQYGNMFGQKSLNLNVRVIFSYLR